MVLLFPAHLSVIPCELIVINILGPLELAFESLPIFLALKVDMQPFKLSLQLWILARLVFTQFG